MKILVTGDRNWRDALLIYTVLEEIFLSHPHKETLVLIQGDANGADVISNACAQILGWEEIKSYPADWSLGKRAGVLRNQQMLDENPDIALVLAFHSDLENSKGTADMVRRAKAAGIEVKVFTGVEKE